MLAVVHLRIGRYLPDGILIDASPIDLRIPETLNWCTDENGAKERADGVGNNHTHQHITCPPEALSRKDAKVLKNNGNLDEAKRQVVDPDRRPEPY